MRIQSRRIPLKAIAIGRNFVWHDHMYVKVGQESAGTIAVKAGQQRPRRTYIGHTALVHPA